MAGDGTGDLIPRPDPSLLTGAAVDHAKDDLRRELTALRELLEAQIGAVRDELQQTWRLHQGDIEKEQVERAALREVISDKFREREQRYHELDLARKEALDTALRTARELVDTKAESAQQAADKFQEAIVRQLAEQARSSRESREALTAMIRGLEQRLDRGEGAGQGASSYRTERRLDYGQIVAALAVIVAVAAVVISAFHH